LNRFYAIRAERGLTQEEVAEGAGLTRQTVMGLETRVTPRPHADTITKLARFYDVPVAELLGIPSESSAA
jgi:transcriptional regulator with XRE-family HTH domain